MTSSTRKWAWAAAAAATTAMAGPVATADLVGLRSDGGALVVSNPNDFTGGAFISNPFFGGVSPTKWAGVAAFDTTADHAGDEVLISRQLDMAAGNGGLAVYQNTADSSGEGQRVDYRLPGYHFAAMEMGLVRNNGTELGIVALRPDISNNRPLFEIWNPLSITSGGGRDEFHRDGSPFNGTWNSNALGVGEISATHAGDEVVVVRTDEGTNNRRMEVYGRTGTGDNTYQRLAWFDGFATVVDVAVAEAVLPNGETAVVALRADGRITFFDPNTDQGDTAGTRVAYTVNSSYRENFILVEDVLDSSAGLEIVTGYYNNSSADQRGYAVYAMPELSTASNSQVPLSLLGVYDLDTELLNMAPLTVPEPATLTLAGLGALLLMRRRG